MLKPNNTLMRKSLRLKDIMYIIGRANRLSRETTYNILNKIYNNKYIIYCYMSINEYIRIPCPIMHELLTKIYIYKGGEIGD